MHKLVKAQQFHPVSGRNVLTRRSAENKDHQGPGQTEPERTIIKKLFQRSGYKKPFPV